MKKNALLFSLFFSFASCSTIETQPITITPKKSDKSIHVGSGIWMEIPTYFIKAKSYDGFQSPDKVSSISVKTSFKTIDDVREIYSAETMSRNDMDLRQLSAVTFDGKENAVFSVVQDNRKKTIKYLLAIREGGITYNIKAFCFASRFEKYDPLIREAIFSSVIDEVVEKEEMFKPVITADLDIVTYTKDGKYPTEYFDQSIIQVEETKSLKGEKGRNLVDKTISKIKTGSGFMINTLPFENGELISGKSEGSDGKAYVALLALNNGKGILIKCSGNTLSLMTDFEDFVNINFFKTKLKRGF